MDSIGSYLGLGGTVAAVIMWMIHSVRHRSHLSQCVQDLQRQRRLDLRLVGCVTDMELLLDSLPASASTDEVPEELVGHARYLFGLRQEAGDNAARLSRHAVQLRWPDGYLGKATLAGARCQLVHGALIQAFESLASATREYERGLAAALLVSGDGASSRAPAMPVRLLDEASSAEVARLRQISERALTHAADACLLKVSSHTVFDTRWPIRRSEIKIGDADPYKGEIKPMGWTGLGPQPLLHIDAR